MTWKAAFLHSGAKNDCVEVVDKPSGHQVEVPDGTVCIIVYDTTNPMADFVVDIA